MKAKSFDLEEPLTEQKVEKLKSHLHNSIWWYHENRRMSKNKLLDRLKEKGFPDQDLKVKDGSTINFIEYSKEFCSNNDLYIDEVEIISDIVQEELAKGNGETKIRVVLSNKGHEQEDIDKALSESLEDDIALDNAYRKALMVSSIQKSEGQDRKNRIIQNMARRGIDLSSIMSYVDDKEKY